MHDLTAIIKNIFVNNKINTEISKGLTLDQWRNQWGARGPSPPPNGRAEKKLK